MEISGARRPMDIGPPRRERRARERTRSQLERQAALEAEARAEGERRLGPAGGPVGEAALASWVRAQATAYLALSPWRRAWLTWRSWGPLRRAVVVLGLACLWTVAILPLRMIGLATVELSQAGVVVLSLLAPVAAFVPPARRGRFADGPSRPGPPWRSSRRAVRIRRLALLGAGALVGAFALAAWFGPGLRGPDAGPATESGERATRIVVERVVSRACPGATTREVRHLGGETYAAALADGTTARVRVEFAGRAPVGAGAGYGELVAPLPPCA
jgi:hypothetical protein